VRLADFPAGGTIFLDANCLIYHFAGTYPSCALLLDRASRREIVAVTSTAILLEVRHRLMMLEAARQLDRPSRQLPSFLKRHPDVIRLLPNIRQLFKQLATFRIRVLPVTHRLVREAHRISCELGLLTNDALTLAVMQQLGVTVLATNDDDFDTITGITVYKPLRASLT